MKTRCCIAALALVFGQADLTSGVAAPSDEPSRVLGKRIANFVLPDTGGTEVGLADFVEKKLIAVVFLGTECPIAKAYIPTLLELRKEYDEQQVEFLAINATPSDTPEAIRRHAEEYGLTFPVLIDSEQTTVSLFGARRLCEVFLLDERRVVRYHGRIDDRFGYDHKRDEPRRRDLAEAIDELLAGKPVSVPETETSGCLITLRNRQAKKGKVTYAEHVAAILQKHCVDCHHPDTAAPFSLLTYEDAANWSEMIREVVLERRMPPWHADPRYGHFENERRLSQDELDTLAAWVESGSPPGELEKAPEPPEFASGWRIGEPDVVFQMPEEFTVPAEGKVRYKYFTTKTNFTEDVWIQAAEARPGNRSVVHHIIVFYRDPARPKQPVWITATAPGAEPLVFPPGYARKVPAGAELVWQMHYTASGKEETDRSEVGFVFCKEPPKHNVTTFGIENRMFRIPPGEPNHQVVSFQPIAKDAVILSLFPHMHLRGKDFKYEAVYPDGRTELLLSVPQYDFNWQSAYRFKEPLRLPQGAILRCTAHFDNSAANPANPDPAKTVRFGEQTWDEMMIGYIDFYFEDDEPAPSAGD